MNIHYRHATAADVPALARLGADTFTDTFGHLYSVEDLNAFLHQQHSIAAVTAALETPGATYHLALDGNTPVGYCLFAPNDLPYEIPGRTMHAIRKIYIEKKYFGSGIAQQLMNWMLNEAYARALDDIVLGVYCDNHRAQAFYGKYGFVKVSEYKFLVGAQVDQEFVYRHRITPDQ